MLLRKIESLLNLHAADTESDPSAVSGWISGLPSFGGGGAGQQAPTANPEPKKEEKAEAKPGDAPAKPAETEKPAVPAEAAKAPAVEKPAEPAAKPEPAKTEDEKWPRTSADWEKFKANRKANEEKLRGEIATYQSKLKEFEAKLQETESKLVQKPAVDPEVETKIKQYEQENAELTETIRRLNVTEHPKFKAHYGGQIDRQVSMAKTIVGTEKGAELEKIIRLPDGEPGSALAEWKASKLEEFTADLSPTQSARVGAIINKLTEITQERDDAIKADMTRAEEIRVQEAKAAQERSVQQGKVMEKLFSDTLSKMLDPKDGHPAFQKRDGDEAWNTAVDQRITTAKAILSGKGFKPDDIAKAAFEAAAYPAMLENQSRLYSENESLRSQLAALQASQPKTASSNKGEGTGERRVPATRSETDDSFSVSKRYSESLNNAWQP